MNELARLLGVPVGVRSVSGKEVGLEGAVAMGTVRFDPAQAHGVSSAA